MIHFDEILTREAWPHEAYVREAGGHSLPDADVNAALTFFERIESADKPPFSPLLNPLRTTDPETNDMKELDVALAKAKARYPPIEEVVVTGNRGRRSSKSPRSAAPTIIVMRTHGRRGLSRDMRA